MQYGIIKTRCRKIIPEAVVKKIDEDELERILSEGIIDIASQTKYNHKNVKFKAEAEIRIYDINDIATDFLEIDESGLWFNNGTEASPQYEPLDPSARKRMDEDFRNWRDDPSGTPERYFIESNLIYSHFKPKTELTDGFLLHYIASAPSIEGEEYYPFSGENEIKQYSILTKTLFLWWRWQAYEILGKREVALKWMQLYEIDVAKKAKILGRRKDTFKDKRNRMRGPIIR